VIHFDFLAHSSHTWEQGNIRYWQSILNISAKVVQERDCARSGLGKWHGSLQENPQIFIMRTEISQASRADVEGLTLVISERMLKRVMMFSRIGNRVSMPSFPGPRPRRMVEAQASMRYYSECEPCLTTLQLILSLCVPASPTRCCRASRDSKTPRRDPRGDSDLSSSQTAVASVDLHSPATVLA
jgi:hypothetical protein